MKHVNADQFKNKKDYFTGNKNKTPQEKMIEDGKIKVPCEIKYNKNNHMWQYVTRDERMFK